MWTLIWFGLAMLEAAAILFLVARVMRMTEKWARERNRATLWMQTHVMALEGINDRSRRLRKIAEQETPGANATVKRMARIAREAL